MDSADTNENANDKAIENTNNDPAKYCHKLISKAYLYCDDDEKVTDAVGDVVADIKAGKIDISKKENPEAFLFICVRNRIFNNEKSLQRNKRRFDIKRALLVGDAAELTGLALDAYKKKRGIVCTTQYADKDDKNPADEW